ncbi:TonB-dependent receptor [Flagellimonas zhangzhouensis]|uniref:TonB-dependent receptor n=1 Tax=Flagellimonas zhangzhouensis TaxID=1073328 RepID=A0A1H2YEA7_9FLAO|nr:TonB-dependent receptor [Allomuricauda zhangzhouensis]SDQ96819.1 TonB-dependent receptor [Allomuricauda zhangzhouensis]SDX03158.1 TonB-dependent receptor [Allomuricauda zhangzhouensis]
MKIIFTLILTCFMISLGICQNGSIQGTIVDENGIYVPGATVVIKELNKGTVSDVDGKFTFLSVPSGNHTLTVKYLGFSDVNKDIVVTEDETTTVGISLTSESMLLDGVEIYGYGISGQARALNTQKNNLNITNVVSTDQIGKFPDANIGDAVKRIPGITMQVDQGEARNIIIRGLAPQLNSVTLNGSRIPSAEGDNRNVQMDLIPSDMIQTIEVNKAVTPDMDADALGGSVNLITKSSPRNFRLSTTLGSGINFINNKRILNGSLLVGDKLGKFGWMVSTTIYDTQFGSDNVEAVWQNKATSPVSGEEIEVRPFVEESDLRTYLIQRIRRSFSANLDYKFNENNTIYLKTIYNWRDDRENRLRLRFANIKPTFADGTETVSGYEGQLRRQTKGGIDGGRIKNTRLEDQRVQNYALSGEHLLNNVKIDWLASYAKASEERPNERYTEYRTGSVNLNTDLSNPRYPSFSAATPSDASLDQFRLKVISEQYGLTQEEDYNVFANVTLPLKMLDNESGTLKFGGRLRFKDKSRGNNFFEYSPTDANPQNFSTLADVPTRDYTKSDFLAGDQYNAGLFVIPTFLGSLDLNNPNLFTQENIPSEYLRANYKVNENVYAGYIMTNQQLSESLNVLVGIRVENTNIEATGNQILGEEDLVGEVTNKSSYTNIMPGIHFKYDLSSKTVLRFAWTNTLARPNYVDVVPFEDVLIEDEEIVRGNAELNPSTSMNFDLMGEYYFNSVGILSGGVFYKKIQDFIYTKIGNQVGGIYDGFKTFRPLNGDNANILGAEIALQRQLDFLPGFAKNFGLYLNYTYVHSKANGVTNSDGDLRGNIELPGSAPNLFNSSLSYTGNKFTTRLSANFSDSYIDVLGGNEFEDRYYDSQFFLDFNATYAINKNLRVYADLNNITNQPLRYFQGVKERTQQVEFYNTRLTFGIKYDVF